MSRRSCLLSAVALALAFAPTTARAADIAKGKETFKMFCASCHGEGGKGDGPGGKGLTPPPLDFAKAQFRFDADKNGKTGEDPDLKAVISQGAAAFGGSPLMSPWAGALTDADIDNVIAVIRSLEAK
jgi:mono/diheme cytochrome c family protein